MWKFIFKLEEKNYISVCEEKVFESVYNEHIESVRNFIYYKNGDLEKAEDIAQESFVKVWQNCKDVIYEKVKGFLLTVANRLFLNEIRSAKVKLNFENNSPRNVENQTPEYLMMEDEFKDKLETAISNLSEKQRVVFLMNRIDKMTFGEIASELEISVKAVEKRMGVALRALKEEVEELNLFKI